VDNQVVNADGEPVLVAQPVPIPQGVSYEGVFGHDTAASGMAPPPPPPAPGLRQIASPGVMSLSRSAAKSTPAFHDVATPEVARPADLVMTLEPARSVFRVGEAVEVRITLRNQGQGAVDVPQQLGFADGSLILWVDGRAVAPGISARRGVTTSLGPGASRTWTVRLPAEAFVAAGRYVVEIRVALPELAGANLAAPGATTAIDVR
jgi:hypothetical protein